MLPAPMWLKERVVTQILSAPPPRARDGVVSGRAGWDGLDLLAEAHDVQRLDGVDEGVLAVDARQRDGQRDRDDAFIDAVQSLEIGRAHV